MARVKVRVHIHAARCCNVLMLRNMHFLETLDLGSTM